MLLGEFVAVYDAKSINNLCGKNAELLFVKERGVYSYHLFIFYGWNINWAYAKNL